VPVNFFYPPEAGGVKAREERLTAMKIKVSWLTVPRFQSIFIAVLIG
jgi:hypothetical protein